MTGNDTRAISAPTIELRPTTLIGATATAPATLRPSPDCSTTSSRARRRAEHLQDLAVQWADRHPLKVANYPGATVERKAGNVVSSEGGAFCKQINSLICEQKR